VRVVQVLIDQGDAKNEPLGRPNALGMLNAALQRENFEAFYGEDKKCYLKHIPTSTIIQNTINPHRPLVSVGGNQKRSAFEMSRCDF